MYINTDIFKIETNHIVPARGKVLISEPFLCDHMFGRSVILLVDHTQDGTMGLVMNKPLPLFLNDLLSEIDCREDTTEHNTPDSFLNFIILISVRIFLHNGILL